MRRRFVLRQTGITTITGALLVAALCNSIAHAQDGLVSVIAGDCTLRLTKADVKFFRPTGKELLIWIGGCSGELASGPGVLFSQKRQGQATFRFAARYNFAQDGRLGEVKWPVYAGEQNIPWKQDRPNSDFVRIQTSQVPAWARFIIRDPNSEVSYTDVLAAKKYLAANEAKAAPSAAAQKPQAAADGSRTVTRSTSEQPIAGPGVNHPSGRGPQIF